MNIKVFLITITLLFGNTMCLHGMDRLKGFFGFNRSNKNAPSKEVSLQKDALVAAKKNGINGHNGVKTEANLITLPKNIQHQIRNSLVTNDLYTTLQNSLLFAEVSKDIHGLILDEQFIEFLAEKFNENPVSIAVALGKFDKTAYERERKRLVNLSQQYDSVKNAEIQRYEEEKDMSGLLALQKYIYFAEKDRLTLSKFPDEVLHSIFDQLITDNLYTTIQNLLPLTRVSRHFHALVFDTVFIDRLSKRFNANPVSVAVALGNFGGEEQQAEQKRLQNLSRADEAAKNRELEKCRRENNIGKLIALKKFGIWLYGYDEENKKPRDYAGFLNSIDLLPSILNKSASPCSEDFFELLLHCYHPDINASTSAGETILLKAIINRGSLSFIEFLIANGANVNAKTKLERTILDFASCCGRKDILELLIRSGASVSFCKGNGASMLHEALFGCRGERYQIKPQDVSANVKLNEIKKRYCKVFKYLLSLDIDINWQGFQNNTAIISATDKGFRKLVKILLDHNADCTLKNNAGKTALDIARENRNTAIINLFERRTQIKT